VIPARLAEGGPEQEAIDAGQIDAIIDYSASNVILLPAARRALREAASRASANALLAALPYAGTERPLAGLEPVTLSSGEVLHEPGAPIRHVFFPLDCVVCLLKVVDHQSLEVGLVGHEGMVGIPLFLGTGVSSVRALVRCAGAAMRMDAARFSRAFEQSPPWQRALHRYAHAKLEMARQAVACGRFHACEARLACWLLMTGDRVQSDEFFLTQAFLANVLGVRRATVNQAAGSLDHRKLIGCRRGRIRILDRKGLEAAACACYAEACP
jgi:CRP-like cAMP-binding protein